MPLAARSAAQPANRKARRAAARASGRRGTLRKTDMERRGAAVAPSPEAARRLARARKLSAAGRHGEAIESLTALLREHPGYTDAHLAMAVIHCRRRDHGRAYPFFKAAATQRPDDAIVWTGFGNCLYNIGQFEAATHAFRQAISLRPETVQPYVSLGQALSMMSDSDGAIAAFEQALRLQPDHAGAMRLLGVERKSRGDFEGARAALERALEIDPDLAAALHDLAELRRGQDEMEDAIETLEEKLAASGPGGRERVSLLFACARLHDRRKEYDAAFARYREANALMKERRHFDRGTLASQVDDTIAAFTPELFESYTAAALDTDRPIFIVGMPRSGTTLVEQIVSSHPDVHPGGEVMRLLYLANTLISGAGRLGYPRDVARIAPEPLQALGANYLDHLREITPAGPARTTDKMPFNFLHLGLIALLFPRATVIHCRRDPMDTCLSNYFQRFSSQAGLEFAWDLDDLGYYYRQYERLMAHWRRVLPMPLHEVCYEELVADHEAGSRRLITHAGLEWDDACLDFQSNERSVKTASLWQVRQPVYTTSVARWRRYEAHLEPLKSALAGGT